ncbi:hypothetical protein PoB_004614300 [Plakobranchus ocellatus]|uniref:Uncharacterized protein n=1 Tax=Plakobranchus ocellatus TaxID=259542 RepID=A0AAV4BKF7_9GAST|nr:hypothetical protein PoB_004614300 [Plakobranchus ocellatus]
MVVVGWVVVASGNSYSNRTCDRGDDNIDSDDVIVVMVKTIVVVAIYGGGWVDGGTDSSNGSRNVGGWVATVVVMILCSGYVFMVQGFCWKSEGMPLWCKDFAEHRNANSRLTKPGRFGEPTLYSAVTLSDYRICDSRHPLLALRSLISVAVGISTV